MTPLFQQSESVSVVCDVSQVDNVYSEQIDLPVTIQTDTIQGAYQCLKLIFPFLRP